MDIFSPSPQPAAMAMDPMMDPMAMLDPEQMLRVEQAVKQAIDDQVAALTTPMYPPWYREEDYPKPDKGKIIAKARQLETAFAPLREQIREDYELARQEVHGAFRDFNALEDNAWKDTGIVGEIELIASQLADANLSFDAPARTMDDADESGRKVDFAIACKQEARRLHAAAGNGPLDLDIARTLLLTGRLAWHIMLNPDVDEDEMPFIEHLIDPVTCFPVFESHKGLRLMVRVFTTTVADAIGAYSTTEHDLSDLLESRGKDGKFKKARDENEVCEIIEYWDRRWRAVFLDGELILGPVDHNFGFVPFVYKLGGLGMPAHLKDPGTATTADLRGFAYHSSYNARDVSMPHKGISLVRMLRMPHLLREAVMTKVLRAFDISLEPPVAVEMDDITYNQGTPEIDRGRNAVNPLKMNRQAVSPIPVTPDTAMLGPMLQGMSDNTARLQLPPQAHGINDKSNVSGYATNSQLDAGLVKLVPHKKTIEEFEAECMQMRFRLFRDWGHMVRQGASGRQGELLVPRADAMPDEDQTFALTPVDLRKSGIKINVTLSTLPIQMLGPLGNAVNIWMNMGLMDPLTALKLRQDPNPHKTLQRIKLYRLLEDETIQELELMEGLRREGLDGYARYIMMRKMQEKMTPSAMGGGAMDGMSGGANGGPVQTVVGDSNAAYGQGPGAGSGPQGPMPPSSPLGTEP